MFFWQYSTLWEYLTKQYSGMRYIVVFGGHQRARKFCHLTRPRSARIAKSGDFPFHTVFWMVNWHPLFAESFGNV